MAKISAPLQFCQKIQSFSQKIVAVANVLILTYFLFCFFSLEQHKTEKKSQIWCNSTKNPQNALDKIISNINLIFVCILAMTESLSIIYYYMMMHIFLDIILFSLRMPLNADPEIHWSHVNFDRVTQEALLRVNIECYWVNMALLVSTDHMHPPRNHRKTFYCSCLQSISPVQRKCTLLATQTHTHTYKSQKWALPVPEKTQEDTGIRDHDQTQTEWVYLIEGFCHSVVQSFRPVSLCHEVSYCGLSLVG